MNTKKHINEEVEKTMQSLDGIDPAKTDPFFYSRLSAKLDHRNKPEFEPESSWSFGFTFAFAALLLIMSINLMFISQYQQQLNEQELVNGQEQWMEELAYDYQAFDQSYYENFELVEE
ncbi:MAG: hypothetical protein WD361_01875 [Gracilimonas sp.]